MDKVDEIFIVSDKFVKGKRKKKENVSLQYRLR